ncbi:hypothetical protein JHK84_034209 [Glycine max]|nr:hypothetical protein JHK84_034209 [Glycine max]
MAFPLSSSSFHLTVARNRITCFSKKHQRHVIAKVTVCNCNTTTTRATPARSVVEKIVKRLRSVVVVPIVLASFPISAFVAPLVDYVTSPGVAEAVLYSPDTKVPRTGEVALRRAIPANANMKAIQIAVDEKDSILASIPAELKEKGSLVHASLIEGKGGLQTLLQSIKEQDADKVSVSLTSTLDTVAELELLQAPGLSFLLPEQYAQQYPRLSGRGTVEFTIEKGDGSTFSPVGGEQKNTATVQVVIDGYSAPLTAGNFAKLISKLYNLVETTLSPIILQVMDGAYNGAKLNCINQAVISDNGVDKNTGYSVPLEIMPSGQFEPLYKTTLSVQDGELPVLPLSVYGALAMAHSEASEEYSSPYQFFFYLYDKRSAGLGGISFDEGQFSVFGYTTTGRDILPQIKTGDVIRSAKLIEGQDRLVLPKES